MAGRWSPWLLCLALTSLPCACSPQDPAQATTDAEIAAMTPLKANYDGVLTGFDVRNDTTLLAAFDTEALDSMDADKEDAMKAAVLARWSQVWAAQHPHHHARLTVQFIDFRARPESSESTKV